MVIDPDQIITIWFLTSQHCYHLACTMSRCALLRCYIALLMSNNWEVWFFQKLWNLIETWQKYCQNKITFLEVKNMTKIAIKTSRGIAVILTQKSVRWLINNYTPTFGKFPVMPKIMKIGWRLSKLWAKRKWALFGDTLGHYLSVTPKFYTEVLHQTTGLTPN